MSGYDAEGLDAWLKDVLLPGWMARLHDPARPGFPDLVQSDGTALDGPQRSTLVTARLSYVFAHAHLLGVPGALDAARHGMVFLWDRCRGADGRFSHRCTVDGTPLDAKSDFYDLAFVLFACGWFARASGEALWLARAEEVMGFIETALAHPAGGFAEDTLGTLPRRQNPHMHLLEACHALAETSGAAIWIERAEALVRLMQARMLDRASGSLAEFFAQDWSLAPGRAGQIREPGHHYEWTWLLHHHDRLAGPSGAGAAAELLFDFAERHRLEGRPVVNEIGPDGGVIDGAALLWPQTEYLKALAARIEFGRDAAAMPALDAHLALIFERFVDPATGLWANRIEADGTPLPAPIPVRVLYHLVLALADVVRVKRLVQARG